MAVRPQDVGQLYVLKHDWQHRESVVVFRDAEWDALGKFREPSTSSSYVDVDNGTPCLLLCLCDASWAYVLVNGRLGFIMQVDMVPL